MRRSSLAEGTRGGEILLTTRTFVFSAGFVFMLVFVLSTTADFALACIFDLSIFTAMS
jgi:hypothetical protein